MTVPVNAQFVESGQLFIKMPTDLEFHTEVTVVNTGGSPVRLETGHPFAAGAVAPIAQQANIDALLFKGIIVLPGTSMRAGLITNFRGIVIDGSMIPTVDYLGAGYNMVSLKARLENIGARVRDEPASQDTIPPT